MKLLITQDGYRLEIGYELGFGPSSYDSLADIIDAFVNEEMIAMHAFIEWDKDLYSVKNMLKDDLLEFFHYDVLHDEDGKQTNKIKDIIYSHYSEMETIVESDDLKNKLLNDFRSTSLNEIDNSLREKIKDYLFGINNKCSLEDWNIHTQEFVKKRSTFYNKEWLFDYEKPIDLKGIYWISIQSKEDTMYWFDLYDWSFKCVIIDKHTDFAMYHYFLDFTEEHGDEFDGMVLKIRENTTGRFLLSVLPRLQKIFSDRIEVV
ncbi:hypothetical protein [uncultured Brevibacillus sp.]|uniref:hypothetical protein n=1 Tax=uncultured Brevibacillus sp. TaxID=169970 RepID=UPI00259A0FC6|nr:hypothetical protein [uncultured Brevibacillus sp.]